MKNDKSCFIKEQKNFLVTWLIEIIWKLFFDLNFH